MLSPGHHDVTLLSAAGNADYYVKSVRLGNQDVLRSGFTAAGSEHVDLEILLAPSAGQFEGVVTDSDGKPVLGAAVVLIPNDPLYEAASISRWEPLRTEPAISP